MLIVWFLSVINCQHYCDADSATGFYQFPLSYDWSSSPSPAAWTLSWEQETELSPETVLSRVSPEGIWDDTDHDDQTNQENYQSRKNSFHILRIILEYLVLSTSMYHLECDSHVPWQLHLHLNRSFATSRTHWFTSISSSLTYSKIEIIFKTIAQACKVLYISHCSIPAADTFKPSRLRGASLSPIRGWVWLLTVIIENSLKIFPTFKMTFWYPDDTEAPSLPLLQASDLVNSQLYTNFRINNNCDCHNRSLVEF